MKPAVPCLLLLALSAALAHGDVGIVQVTVVPADYLGPNGALLVCPLNPVSLAPTVNTITVKSEMGDPIFGATVVVLLGGSNPACASAVLSGVTNGSGVTTITLGAGGCSHQIPGSGVIKVNGVTVRSYANAKSPDFDGAMGNRSVNLSDLVEFSNQFTGLDPAACHDYDNDQDCDVGDLVIFGAGFSGANSCP